MNTLLDSAELWLSPMALLSWKGTLLTLVVGLSLLLLRRHLSPAWRHGLWLLVVLRFLLPDLGTSELSISGITPAPVSIPALAATDEKNSPPESNAQPLAWNDDNASEPVLNTPQDAMPDSAVTVVAQTDATPVSRTAIAPATASSSSAVMAIIADAKTAPAWPLSRILTCVWLGGAAAVLGLMALLHVRLLLRIRRDATPASAEAEAILRKACDLARVRRMPRLIHTDAIRAPSLFGLLRPAILLPKTLAADESPTGLKLIFLHELAHLKRWDLGSQILASLAIALHWYNPVMWWAGRRLRAEAEMAADAHALRCTGTGVADVHRMGELLLGFANHAVAAWITSFLAVTQMGISDNKHDLRRRIEALMDIARGRHTRWFVGLGLFFLLALVGLTNAPAEEAPKKVTPPAAAASTTTTAAKAATVSRKSKRPTSTGEMTHFCRLTLPATVPQGTPATPARA